MGVVGDIDGCIRNREGAGGEGQRGGDSGEVQGIRAVARVLVDRIRARAVREDVGVITCAAVQGVVAGAASDGVGRGIARQGVIALAASDVGDIGNSGGAGGGDCTQINGDA